MASIQINNQLRHALRRVNFTGRSYTVEPPATIEPDTLIGFQAEDTGSVTYAVAPDPTKPGAVPWPDNEPAKQFTLQWHFAPDGTPAFSTAAVDRSLRLKKRERRKGITYLLSPRRERREPPHPPHRGRLLRLPPLAGSVAVIIATAAAVVLGYVGIVQGKVLGNIHFGGPSRPAVIVTPTFTAVPLVPSTITIIAPAANSNLLSTSPATFTAVAVDIHGNQLPDSAFTWKDDVDGTLGPGSSIEHAPTVKGDGACTITPHQVTATALDPLERGTPLMASITVNAYTGAACKLAITAPANNTFNTGQSVTFTATATDAVGSAVPGSAISWKDDIDRGLGTGASITHGPSVPSDACKILKHHVTASSGKLAATITVSTYSGGACQLKISAPANNSNANAQSPTTFKATATDALGNQIAGSAISWSDDVDGGLGSGGSVQHTPSVTGGGACTITKHHVTASAGAPSATVAVSAYTGAACKLAITAPGNNSYSVSSVATTFQASLTDALGSQLSTSGVTWSDDVDGGLGSGGSVNHALSYNGNYTDSLGYPHYSLCITTKHTVTASAGALSASVVVYAYSGVACHITITAPTQNSNVASSSTFNATATDEIGHQLPGSVITWYESNNALATGGSVNLALSSNACGVSHQIVAVANDNSADGVSDVRYVTAYDGSVCFYITAPASGSTFSTGTSITFSAVASMNGQALPISWGDYVDGYMGSGSTINFALSGSTVSCDPTIVTHGVSAYTTDSNGRQYQQSIVVYIQAPCIIY